MEDKKNINYIQILKDAWGITWKNKFLWWFGFFIAIGGGGMSSSNFNFPGEEEEASAETIESMNYYWSMYWEWIVAGLVILFIISIIVYILNIIGRGGLISSLIKINKGEEANFSIGFKDGKRFFWRLFVLNIFFAVSIIFILIIIIFPIARLVFLEAHGAAAILGLIAFPIIISIFILAAFLKIYSQIYIVANEIRVRESIRLSYGVFKKKIKESILMGLLLMVVGVVVGIGLMMIIVALIIPFAIVGLVAHLSIGIAGSVGAGVLGLITIIVFSMFWQSAYMVFMQATWVLFFNEIANVSEEKESSLEDIEEKVPEMGRA